MITTLTSKLLGPAPRCLRLVAAAAVVCLLAQAASAQDTDDDGVLPVSGSGAADTQPINGGGNGTSEAMSAETSVLVAGELVDVLDPAAARIEFETTPATTELVTGAPAEAATFVADQYGVAGGSGPAGPSLQGSGLLYLHEGLKARFVAAVFAKQSVAFLVLDQDGDSLKSELAGLTQPELVVPLGAAAPLDIAKLAAVTAQYAEELPGYHATVVFVSVYAGEMKASGVRAHTDGGPVEVLAR
ncbi:MAG TPA: hypothetical protein VMV01_20410 [Planctomycetota bacterium]|nr:hypothetical protein [Planctomycetota bacterium]